ncbi:MAG: hypothetical protein EZS28_036919 [Streblomastix strix]|uniref:Uncharacterized protein n=1 Tax=Streblomastix strix TaxID=222440 RepID=A0A5J4UBK0_9EUKA|nr:MAG: hypothetical protein EZS28_036919 [Streblomastix strix]
MDQYDLEDIEIANSTATSESESENDYGIHKTNILSERKRIKKMQKLGFGRITDEEQEDYTDDTGSEETDSQYREKLLQRRNVIFQEMSKYLQQIDDLSTECEELKEKNKDYAER